MKNNYPIKYALIPMIEQTGWTSGLHNIEREYSVVCYIVSKCYLVKETKDYNKNGVVDTKYHVVCPYYCKSYDELKRQEPTFNLFNESCTNSVITDELFDSFEDALIVKNRKNEELFIKNVEYMSFKDLKEKYKTLKEEHDNRVNNYTMIEEAIESNLNNLKINDNIKEQNLVMFDGEKYKKINKSLYDIVNIFDDNDYIAYTLTPNQYLKLQKDIGENKIVEDNYEILLLNDGKNKITSILPNSNKVKYLYEEKIYDSLDINNVFPSNIKIKFYTIEDYDDIIQSYNNVKDNNKVLKLVRKNKI